MATRRAGRAAMTRGTGGAKIARPARPSEMARGVGDPPSPTAAAFPRSARSADVGELPAVAERRRPDVSVQRALACDVERAWRAWSAPKEMAVWFKPRHQQRFAEGGTYRNADRDRGEFRRIGSNSKGSFFRMTWENKRHTAGSSVLVEVLDRGPGRCTVRLTHSRIGTDEEREELRVAWSRALDSLKSWIEKGEPVSASAWSASSHGA